MTPTERALILAKREGYANALIIRDKDEGAARAEARRVYPLTETRDREVTEVLGAGIVERWRFHEGRFQTVSSDTTGWTTHWLTLDFLRSLLDLAERPTETVAVDEDTAADEPAIPRCAK